MPSVNPNPAGFQTTVRKDTTTPPGIPSSILPLIVIGYASDADGLPVNTPTPFSTPGAVQEAGGSGPAVEHAAGSLDANGGVKLVHVVNVETTTDAAYGTITTTFADADAPTVEGDTTALPEDDFDVVVRFAVGGDLGTTGIKYQVSLDRGLHFFAPVALGTATSITLPNGGGTYLLNPPEDALVAIATEIRADLLAHFANATAHNSADTTAAALITLGAPTDNDEAIDVLNECRTAYNTSHRLNDTVHDAADSTNTITAPAATTKQSAVTLAIELKTKINAHEGTAAPVHNSADVTNTITTPDPERGTIRAGDKLSLSTTAPAPDATQIAAAMQSLRTYAGDAGTIALSQPITGSMVSTIETELIELWKRGKFYNVVAPWRRPTLIETASEYSEALEADLTGIVLVDLRVASGAVYHESALINTADGRATPRRPNAWWVSMAAARNEPQTYLGFVEPQRGVRITDSRGNVLPGCLDESSGNLYSVQNRTGGTTRDPFRDPTGLGVFLTQDLVLYDRNSDWILGPHSAVINYALRTAAPVIVKASSNPDGFPSPPTGPLDDEVVKGLEATAQSFLDVGITDQRRATSSTVQITDSSSATLKYKVTNVPNYYPINGVEITASIVSREV